MHLEKTVPKRTKRIEFDWVARYWIPMSKWFRDRRSKSRNKMDKCFWCKKKFEDGEMMGIARRTGKGSVVLCQKCADELERTDDQAAD